MGCGASAGNESSKGANESPPAALVAVVPATSAPDPQPKTVVPAHDEQVETFPATNTTNVSAPATGESGKPPVAATGPPLPTAAALTGPPAATTAPIAQTQANGQEQPADQKTAKQPEPKTTEQPGPQPKAAPEQQPAKQLPTDAPLEKKQPVKAPPEATRSPVSDIEQRTLEPPRAVKILLQSGEQDQNDIKREITLGSEDATFEFGSPEHDQLVRDAIPWIVEALVASHSNEEAKKLVRRLFAVGNFSLQLLVAEAWDPLMQEVKSHLQELGRPLREKHSEFYTAELNSGSLKIELTSLRAGDPVGVKENVSAEARLDCKGFLALPDWEWEDPVAMCEQVWIHVIRLIALAINERFAAQVSQRLAGVAEVSVAGIKSFTRMLNKMNAKNDHRFVRRPRPSRNVDVNRCLAVVEDEGGMRALCDICQKHFGVVKVKNGFDLSAEAAADIFELRVVMMSLRYQDGRSYGVLARDPKVKEMWKAYVDEKPEHGTPAPRWKAHARRALEWLQSASIEGLSVVTMVEVQAVIRPYYEVRQHMHELYRVIRAETPVQLHLDFLRSLKAEPLPEPLESYAEATTLWEAAEWQQPETALILAANDPDSLDKQDHQGYTPLLICAEKGCAEVAKVLIASGARSIDTPLAEGDTPVLLCARYGNAEVAQVLVDAGANIDIPDRNGLTPLLWCAQEGHADVAEVLVTAGAQTLDTPTDDGNTPLLWCADEGFTDVAIVLIEGGAKSIDEPRNDGYTPMLLAAERGFRDLVLELVNGGADLEAAIELAGSLKCQDALQLLRQVQKGETG